jgi:hypothetical protein
VITHVVLRRFNEGTTTAQIVEAHRDADALTEIEGIRAITHGPNLGIAPLDHGFNYIMLVEAADEAAIQRFIADPRHKQVADRVGVLTNRLVVLDVETPGSS